MTSILDTIDNAVSDWETSADAMRWTPEPSAQPVRPLIMTPTMDQLAAAARMAESFARVRVQMAAVAESFAEAMKGIGLALRQIAGARQDRTRRPERVARTRRDYRAKRGGRW